jgi:hypothetical protein
MKTKDKLQKYAASKVLNPAKDAIWSASTNSGYFNFNGSTLRISDHLPSSGTAATPGITMSIIITSDPNVYVLQQHSTGRLTVVNYNRAKEIVRSFAAISDIFRYPVTPFKLEKEYIEGIASGKKKNILGVPLEHFTAKQLSQIKSFATQANGKRLQEEQKVAKAERAEEHLKTPSK